MHSVRAVNDFEEVVVRPSGLASALAGTRQAEGAHGRPAAHSPAARVRQPVEMVPRAPLNGLWPNTWAALFQGHPDLLQSLLPWVRQEL